jgi:hypothetical protein
MLAEVHASVNSAATISLQACLVASHRRGQA